MRQRSQSHPALNNVGSQSTGSYQAVSARADNSMQVTEGPSSHFEQANHAWAHILRGAEFGNLARGLRPQGFNFFEAMTSKCTLASPEAIAEPTEPVERKCLICMGKETRRKELILLPCKNICNRNLVHTKCIFEWKEQHEGRGSCPLCRGRLGKISYSPPDYLNSKSISCSYNSRKLFNMSPVAKKAGMVRCFLKVKNNPWWGSPYLYEFYLQKVGVKKYPHGPLPTNKSPAEGDILLMTGKKRTAQLNAMGIAPWGINFHSTIDISMENDFERNSKNYIGCVQASSFTGLEYTVNALVYEESAEDSSGSSLNSKEDLSRSQRGKGLFRRRSKEAITGITQSMGEVASVHYNQNRIGAESGPRKMKLCIPSVTKISKEKCGQIILGREEILTPTASKDAIGFSTNCASNSIKSAKVEARNSVDIGYNSSEALLDRSTESSLYTSGDADNSNLLSNIEDFSDDEDEGDSSDDDFCLSQSKNGMCDITSFHRPLGTKENLNKLLRRHKGPLSAAQPSTDLESNSAEAGYHYGQNKKPCWLARLQAYSLDFHGRVTLPSNKNFQIELGNLNPCQPRRRGDEEIVLQFGKVVSADECVENVSVYTVDFKYPMSPLQALGICLSSCDRKFGCA